MKRLFGIALVAALVGCATAPVGDKSAPESAKEAGPEPVLPQLVDPNPFANYSTGMASDKDHPMAYEWQSANDGAIAKATSPDVLLGVLESDMLTKQMLSKVLNMDNTDPMAATQIAAISQLVTSPACPKASAMRDKWVRTLIGEVRNSKGSEYRKLFVLDQLRWCGRAQDAGAVRFCVRNVSSLLSGKKATGGQQQDCHPVLDFADMVARELEASK